MPGTTAHRLRNSSRSVYDHSVAASARDVCRRCVWEEWQVLPGSSDRTGQSAGGENDTGRRLAAIRRDVLVAKSLPELWRLSKCCSCIWDRATMPAREDYVRFA